jgi:hypothetical protein
MHLHDSLFCTISGYYRLILKKIYASRKVSRFKPTVPDKLKGGKLERLGDQKFKSLKFKVIY